MPRHSAAPLPPSHPDSRPSCISPLRPTSFGRAVSAETPVSYCGSLAKLYPHNGGIRRGRDKSLNYEYRLIHVLHSRRGKGAPIRMTEPISLVPFSLPPPPPLSLSPLCWSMTSAVARFRRGRWVERRENLQLSRRGGRARARAAPFRSSR